jgi:cell division inhibitor SulA
MPSATAGTWLVVLLDPIMQAVSKTADWPTLLVLQRDLVRLGYLILFAI